MDWKPWDAEQRLEMARRLTAAMRTSEDDYFLRLRLGMLEESIDPNKSVLTDFSPDGGPYFGVFVAPEGTPYKVDVLYGPPRESAIIDELEYPSDWVGYGTDIYFGWVIQRSEGNGPSDPVRALVPGVAALTANFRDGEVEEWLGSRARDWSLLNGLLRAEGVEPDRVVMFARADVLVEGSSSLVATLLFPDERVFLWGAKTDGDFQPATTTKWRQLSDAEIVESCGPLYDAALRLLQEQGETRHL